MDLELPAREKELAKRGREFCDRVLIPMELIVDEHGEAAMERRAAIRQAVCDGGFAGINRGKQIDAVRPAAPGQERDQAAIGIRSGGRRTDLRRPRSDSQG